MGGRDEIQIPFSLHSFVFQPLVTIGGSLFFYDSAVSGGIKDKGSSKDVLFIFSPEPDHKEDNYQGL